MLSDIAADNLFSISNPFADVNSVVGAYECFKWFGTLRPSGTCKNVQYMFGQVDNYSLELYENDAVTDINMAITK